jgi:hypothetical protein
VEASGLYVGIQGMGASGILSVRFVVLFFSGELKGFQGFYPAAEEAVSGRFVLKIGACISCDSVVIALSDGEVTGQTYPITDFTENRSSLCACEMFNSHPELHPKNSTCRFDRAQTREFRRECQNRDLSMMLLDSASL